MRSVTSRPYTAGAVPDYLNLPLWRSLVRSGQISREQLQQIWQTTQTLHCSVLEALETVTKRVLPPQKRRAYRQRERWELQIRYGVPYFDPKLHPVSFAWIRGCLQGIVSLSLCDHYHLIPLQMDPLQTTLLWVGMLNPDHSEAIDNLHYVLHHHGLGMRRWVISIEDYYTLLHHSLDPSVIPAPMRAELPRSEPVQSLPAVQSLPEFPPDLEIIAPENIDLSGLPLSQEATHSEVDLERELRLPLSHPVVSLVNVIIYKALQEGVSDIHFEPQETALQIRFRKDGILHLSWPPLPRSAIPVITSRIKILANLDIADRRVPQDGHIRLKFQTQKVVLRVSTLPTYYGEKVVLRILKSGSGDLLLETFMTDLPILEQFRDMIRRPYGLILVTGPTGSGKSTTLYAAIAEKNTPQINISTVEDPVEYILPGISQVQVIREKGMDFPQVLRALLRQDPDVILVGEIRDRETAKVAVEASLTGHLVLSTLHTNDSAGTIVRLQELGVDPFRVSSCLIGVLAQRLVRRVCPQCRIPYHPTAEDWRPVRWVQPDIPQHALYRAKVVSALGQDLEGACTHCKGMGYKGRVGVYELLKADRGIKDLIIGGASADDLRDAARSAGMKTLTDYGLQLVLGGQTTLEEVERVLISSVMEEGSFAPVVPRSSTTAAAPDYEHPAGEPQQFTETLLALIQYLMNHPNLAIENRLRWSDQLLQIVQFLKSG